MKARIEKAVDPIYPEEALEKKVAGAVLLEVVVDKAGKVETVKVIKGHPLLDKAATECVKKWIFKATESKYKGDVLVVFKPKQE